MDISPYKSTILELFPKATGQRLEPFMIRKGISIINLVTGVGAVKISDNALPWVKKLLQVINTIVLEKFDNVSDFLNEFQIDEYWMARLSSGNFVPNRIIVDKLVIKYKVNPGYIWDESDDMFL